jgi:hypothetical protein
MIAMIANQGKLNQIKTFREGPVAVEHRCGNSSETVAQAYLYATTRAPGLPIGLSTDMNAMFYMPGPRFGADACPGGAASGRNEAGETRLGYPFVAKGSGQMLAMSVAVENDPRVTKRFDFNTDGVAHIGMVPDLIEDLSVLGIPAPALEPLFSSAEGYIRAWERATYMAIR